MNNKSFIFFSRVHLVFILQYLFIFYYSTLFYLNILYFDNNKRTSPLMYYIYY